MQNEFNHTIEERDKKLAYDAIPVISYEECKTVVDKWLLIVDPGIVKLLHAVMFANKLDSDGVWLNMIAPSAGGKTMLLDAFLKVPECYSISTLTSNTFLSGYKSKDKTPSLLHQLGSGKTLIFKDFTSLLDGNYDELKAIMGQLREIFDGRMVKRTGTGDELTWTGKLGFIAASTPIIEQRMNLIGAMGERFLSYYVKQPKRADLKAKMKQNIGKEKQMRQELQDAFAGVQKGLVLPEILPDVPEEVEKLIDSLTDFIAISRAVVMRGFDSKKEIEWIAPPEMSGRVFKQFYTLAISLIIMNKGVWNPEDTLSLQRLATSSIHSTRYNLITHIMAYIGPVKTSTLAMELGYPTSTIRRYLEDLAAISMDEGMTKILHRTHQGKGKPDLWEITTEMKVILRSMGEEIKATKIDKGLTDAEEEIPVTEYSGNGHADEQKKLDDITGDLSPEDIQRFGL